jgi:hypothetical protein
MFFLSKDPRQVDETFDIETYYNLHLQIFRVFLRKTFCQATTRALIFEHLIQKTDDFSSYLTFETKSLVFKS